jgi:hypothetical protein
MWGLMGECGEGGGLNPVEPLLEQEKLVDLLTPAHRNPWDPAPLLKIRQHPDFGVYVEGATEETVGTYGKMRCASHSPISLSMSRGAESFSFQNAHIHYKRCSSPIFIDLGACVNGTRTICLRCDFAALPRTTTFKPDVRNS